MKTLHAAGIALIMILVTAVASFAADGEVPEPATLGLVGAGLIGIGVRAFKRRHRR